MSNSNLSKFKKSGLQAQKSENTKIAILNATVDSIYKLGYTRTSTKIIADSANVSRGAMIHHFPSKADLMNAVVGHLIDLRIDAFTKEVVKLKSEEEREQFGLDIYWDHLKSRNYTVYHELTVASRTDKELSAVMKEGTRRLEKRWEENIKVLFPEWSGAGELFDLANDIVQFSYEGMVLNHLSHDDNRRRARVRTYIKARVRELLENANAGELDPVMKDFIKQSKEQ